MEQADNSESSPNSILWLWVPAFAGTTMESAALLPPSQRQRITLLGQFQQPRSRCRMQRLQRMAHGVRLDHATGLHHDLAGDQAALAVLVVDQRQPALIGGLCLLALAGEIGIDDLAAAIG